MASVKTNASVRGEIDEMYCTHSFFRGPRVSTSSRKRLLPLEDVELLSHMKTRDRLIEGE